MFDGTQLSSQTEIGDQKSKVSLVYMVSFKPVSKNKIKQQQQRNNHVQ